MLLMVVIRPSDGNVKRGVDHEVSLSFISSSPPISYYNKTQYVVRTIILLCRPSHTSQIAGLENRRHWQWGSACNQPCIPRYIRAKETSVGLVYARFGLLCRRKDNFLVVMKIADMVYLVPKSSSSLVNKTVE